ncbi:YybH family protein [Erythrobacter alti]|uniref:YybH family protein n=1 Tax=Erythrobacter alti TaxID=1896145 RepID=UPI0030F3C9C6
MAVLVVTLAAPLAACGSPASESERADQSAIGEAVMADVGQTVAAYNARDAERAVRSTAPDFVQIAHGQPNADQHANLANTSLAVADPALEMTINDEEVVVTQAGDMAIYSSRYAYTHTDPQTDEAVVEEGNWLLIYRRQPDGTIKIYREIVSALPAEAQ